MVRFLYAMPARERMCKDHSAEFLFKPGYSYYVGVITASIFEEVKKIVSQFDVVLGVDSMEEDMAELGNVLDERGIWDKTHQEMTDYKVLNKGRFAKIKIENQEVVRMLNATNVWDNQLYAYLLQLKALRKERKVAERRL
jgi:hypothetical protein